VQPPPPPPRDAVAATVNGRPIYEIAVYRPLRSVPPAGREEARKEILNFLIDTAIVDQYLEALKVAVEPKEVENKFKEVMDEIKKNTKEEPAKLLEKLLLTEVELRAQILAQLRWEKFVDQQAPEPKLRAMFDGNKDMFNGSAVHARHLLLTPAKGDAKAAADAKVKLAAFKKQVEAQAQQALAKLPATADNLAKEKARTEALDKAFAELARKESACPSKTQGGDVGWFPRTGKMVEPFARAAFAAKSYDITDVVETEFGYHLILVVEHRRGKDVKFEDVRELVKDVYSDRLREAVLARMRPRAQIVINPAPKQ
jgi:parvulin-like peptidyl-prolyl isomerase